MIWSCACLSALGPAYIAVRGYAAPEAGPVLARARELCERVGTVARSCSGSCWERGSGAWCGAISGPCIDLAGDGMTLAEGVNDPGMLMEALFMRGATNFYRAEFADARADYEKAIEPSTTTGSARSSWMAATGHSASVTHRCYLALALWHLGCADQAMEMAREQS